MSALNSSSSKNALAEWLSNSPARIESPFTSPRVLIALLISATALNRYRFDVASLGIRLEHLAFVIVGGICLIQARHAESRWRGARVDVLLVIYLLVALLASLLNAPSPGESLKFLGLMTIAVALYGLVQFLVTDAATFRIAIITLLVVAVIEAVSGLVAWFSYFFGLQFGVEEYPILPPGPGGFLCSFTLTMYGTLFEANIYGSYIMGASLMGTALWLSPRFRASRHLLIGALGVLFIALGFNASRSALVGLVFGFILALVLSEERRRLSTLGWIVASLIIVTLALVGSTELSRMLMRLPNAPNGVARSACPEGDTPPSADVPLKEASSSANQPAPLEPPTFIKRLLARGTVFVRLDTLKEAFDAWRRHPWLGNGANSFRQTVRNDLFSPDWISNLGLMTLHDTGIIGLSVLLIWLVSLARDLWRAVRVLPRGFLRTALIGLALGLIGLLAAYQATTAFWLGFTWIYFGLARAGTLIARRGNVPHD